MSQFAYITVLYGNNIYLTGALVLGYSLMKTDTKLDRVILVTPDVSSEYRSYLKKVYTDVIEIEYVKANPNIFFGEDNRFIEVFTKLRCLGMVQYQKVLLLDLDMIVSQNIDHLFSLDPPAACIRRYDYPYGLKIPAKYICANGKLVGGINAGLMLLEPNLVEWDDIQKDIQDNPKLHKFKNPEQDYLSLRYCSGWTSITFNYNFQFGLTNRVKKLRYNAADLFVIHYSSSYKPWNDLVPTYQPSEDEKRFKRRHLKYYKLWQGLYQFIKKKFANDGIELPY